MRILMICLIVVGPLLTGCTALTRTPYHPPEAKLPVRFEHASEVTAAMQHDAWWESFHDPRLNAWVGLALARNTNLAAAGIRVRRAALEARLAGNALRPIINASVGTGVNRPMTGSPSMSTEYASGNLGVSWEIDLFDRLGAKRDAATFEAMASLEDREAVALSLVATTANLYWQLGFANERVAAAQLSVSHARRTLALVEIQFRSGAVSILEQREAEQSLAQQEVLLSQLTQTRNELRQALTVLFDGAEIPFEEPQRLRVEMLPAVAAGLPAELLGRRPDLRASELRLKAVLASGDASVARYYPALTLTGGLGTSSRSLLDVLANPVATLGGNLTLPFLNAGEMRLNSEIARTRYEEAVFTFRQLLYTALTEVERALSGRLQLAQQAAAQQRAMDEAISIERLYEVRYRAGYVPLRAWLDAQERRRAAELTFNSVCLEQLQNMVRLHQALGGSIAKL